MNCNCLYNQLEMNMGKLLMTWCNIKISLYHQLNTLIFLCTTPITCAVIITHYSNMQLILIVYNTAYTSARTLIENTDSKMNNYRATMSLMSNSDQARLIQSPFHICTMDRLHICSHS